MRRAKFQAPRLVTAFGQVQHALAQIADDLRTATRGGYLLALHTRAAPEVLTLEAGAFHRVSAPVEGAVAVLPIASELNGGEYITLSLENMRGTFTIHAAPGQTVNGASTTVYSLGGVVQIWSNGVDAWISVAQLAGTAGVPITPAGGATGPQGFPGEDGQDGRDGFPGPPGAVGQIGPRGFDGEQGEPGQDGFAGPAGAVGPTGATGDTGPIGPRGFDGEQGEPGQDGFPGAPGAAGPTGPTGPAGAAAGAGSMAVVLVPDPAEEPGEFIPRGWGGALRSGPRTGGASAFVDVGDFLNFGLDGPTTSNPQIRSGDAIFRIRCSQALSAGGDTGALVFSTGAAATTEVAADGGAVALTTSLTDRLRIASTGHWTVSGGAGTSGQVITNQGPGTPPVWATPAAATAARDPLLALLTEEFPAQESVEPALQNFASVLFRDPRGGAAKATLDGQAGGEYRLRGSSSDTALQLLTTAGTNNGTIFSGAALTVQGGTSVGITSSGSVGVTSTASNVTVFSSADVTITPGSFCKVASNGFLKLDEASASTPSLSAGEGMFWVRADAPNLPMFTDDTNVDVPLKKHVAIRNTVTTITNSTVGINGSGSFTIPANTLVVGSSFRIKAAFQYLRGATATAQQLTVNGSVGAVTIGLVTAITSNVNGFVGYIELDCVVTILTTGAGGTAFAYLRAMGNTAAGNAFAFQATNTNPFAVNTTIALAVSGTCNMSAAVLATTLNAVGGHVEWIS